MASIDYINDMNRKARNTFVDVSKERRAKYPSKSASLKEVDDLSHTGDSYGFPPLVGRALSVHSSGSSRSSASSLVTAQGPAPPRLSLSPNATLPPPCHLQCHCQQCRTPNSDLLDNLMNLTRFVSGSNEYYDSISTLGTSFGDLQLLDE